jgi:hypothetical protein
MKTLMWLLNKLFQGDDTHSAGNGEAGGGGGGF